MTKGDHKKQQHKKSEEPVDVTALQQQISDLTEALQRERADATNLRRLHNEQIAGLRVSAKAQVVQQLLPVIDNFERALKHIPRSYRSRLRKRCSGYCKTVRNNTRDMGVVI
jgi:molecular chaperone GrpE (heat shock protein)